MVQITILSGKQAGSDFAVRLFPFSIGRSASDQLRLDDPGVWDRHVEVAFDRKAGFSFRVNPAAALLVNGSRQESGLLRNGDSLVLGAVELRFWLSRTRQKSMRAGELFTWIWLFLLFAAQIFLIYALLR